MMSLEIEAYVLSHNVLTVLLPQLSELGEKYGEWILISITNFRYLISRIFRQWNYC
jgi:hypothetical protein